METRRGTQGDLAESGGSARAKKASLLMQQKYGTKHQRRKGSQIIGYGQKGNQISLQFKFQTFSAGNTEQGKCRLTNEYPSFLFLIGRWYYEKNILYL